MMVHHIVTRKHHLYQPKSFIHSIHKLWSTVVWLNLPKFITNNSKLIKIFSNLHLIMSFVCPLLSMKNNKYEWIIFIYQCTLRVEVRFVSQSCAQLATLWTINSPIIVQITSNLAQGCTFTCQMIFSWCPANLVWNFPKIHAKTQI